jgi:drug efflux transport system permease protein
MNIRRTRAIALKEFRHIVRDPRSLGLALALPLFMLLLFGFALTLDVDRITTVVYDQDNTPQSRQLVERFRGSRYFQILGAVDNYKTIERRIDKNQALLAIVIPTNYSRRLLQGQEADVQLLLDGSDSNTASIAMGYAESIVRGYALELRSEAQNFKGGAPGSANPVPAVDAGLRVWYNSALESKNFVVPGLVAVILMIIASLLSSLTIAREWEMGTMEQLLSTPLRPAEMVLGKMLAFFVVGLADMLIAVVVGVFVFRVPFRGNPLLLLFSGCIFLMGSLFWGIYVSAATRTQSMAYQLGMTTSFLPAFMLSGFIYSIQNMPWVIRAVTFVVPARYFVTILTGVFLKGIGLEILWVQVLFLMVFAALVFLLATRKLREKMA